MERLTRRDEFGNGDIIGVDSRDLQCNLKFNEFNKVTVALNKLAEYEDLEEQGKLLKAPFPLYSIEKIIDVICQAETDITNAIEHKDREQLKNVIKAYL